MSNTLKTSDNQQILNTLKTSDNQQILKTSKSQQMSNTSKTSKSPQMSNVSKTSKSPQMINSVQTTNISKKLNNPVKPNVSLHQNGVDDKTDEGGVRWLSQQMSAPRPLVICGPSGSGKSTLLKYLMAEYGDCFGFSVSHTTRKPRPGETHGKEYNFVDHSEMEKAIANGDFLEFTEFSGNIYGTSKSAVQSVQDQGRICILDIEIDGVRNIKKTDLNPRYVFIKPPSIKVLEQRLRSRGTESEDSIKKRLARAREELAYGETTGNFDTVIMNDDAKEAYKQLKLFLLRDIEELKKRREEKKQIEEKKKIEEQKMLEQKKNEH